MNGKQESEACKTCLQRKTCPKNKDVRPGCFPKGEK